LTVLACGRVVAFAVEPKETAMNANTDRIEKQVLLNVPRERMWRALADAEQFGRWFGVRFDAPFAEGGTVTGRITPTEVDAEVAAMQKPHEGKPFEWVVGRIEPMQRITFRWHPFAVDEGADYASEPMTRIVFELHDAPDGILLTVTESGFDALPPARREKAFAANYDGWAHQMTLIAKYLVRQ
jgi:uncharacterized protein YndB with AHSA1/START domain